MAENEDDCERTSLITGRELRDRDPRSVETMGHPQAGNFEVTGDPLDELGHVGRASFEDVCVGLNLKPRPTEVKLGRYLLERCIGSGGMGVVHLAMDPKLEREVAIKRVRPRPHLSTQALRDRLEREGKTLARLGHPNVVHVYEIGEHEGEIFLAMEYVKGETLRDWERRPERTEPEIIRAYVEAGKGLAAAHAKHVIHRDFKPDNVFVSDKGRIQVGDFGLAGLIHELDVATDIDRLTNSGDLLGTLPYVAPERLRGEAGDARSDQFAFSVALWRALTQEWPFSGDQRPDLLRAVAAAELRGGTALPRWLRKILSRGLAAEPDHRYPDMGQLVAALERGLGRGKRWLTGGVLSLAGLVATLGVGFGLASRSSPRICAVELALAQTPEPSQWHDLRARLGQDLGRLDDLEQDLRSLASQTQQLCRTGDRVQIEHETAWLEDLNSLIDGSLEGEALYGYIDWLHARRSDGPPPKPLSPETIASLHEAERRTLANDLDGALDELEHADARSSEPFERAEIRLRRGRVLSLQGNYEQARSDFEAARADADAARYDDARLRANLLAAEIALKRLHDFKLAQDHLASVAPIATRIEESWLSPRRALYEELLAVKAQRQGQLNLALALQLRVLLRHRLAGTPAHVFARSLAGLGVILEDRGNVDTAERCYRAALVTLPGPSPDRYQVTFLLGRSIAERAIAGDEHARTEESQSYLREAAAGRPELAAAALTVWLRLELLTGADTGVMAQLGERLFPLLGDDSKIDPVHQYEGWQSLALAAAAANDAGELERAAAHVYKLSDIETDKFALAAFDLSIASLTPDSDIRVRYAATARSRLEGMPHSTERDELLEAIQMVLMNESQ